ncbi:MAG: IS1595 family transposase [Flavobacterium sp.]|nr:MAG: IS1595 family transposase [Flavobacterium sp.]
MLAFASYDELVRAFPDEDSALAYLEQVRWNGIVISPFAANSKVYNCSGGKYKCRDTGKYFNAKTNTIFHNSRISLQKWFAAIWMIAIDKSGTTSVDLAKELGITQKTAWYMMQRIREYFEIKKVPRKSYAARKKAEKLQAAAETEKLKMSDWLTMLKK